MLVVDSLIFRYNQDDSVIHIDSDTHSIYQDNDLISESVADLNHLPLVEKTERRCGDCQHIYQDNLQLPYHERYVPIATVGDCKEHGLFFNSIGPIEQDTLIHVNRQRTHLDFSPADFAIVSGPKSKSLLDKGIDNYLDVYSSRQLLFLQQAISILPPF
ncbi:MAG: hypothetical protein M5U34_36600 [Chloroflexi bacterium]|nr:hypothetical protein [Chloroflexota bacterium]